MAGRTRLPDNIVVYARPNCAACEQVIRYLANRSLHFRVLDVERDADAQADLNAAGYTEDDLPVTFLDDAAVVGFDANRLDAYLVHITI
ncbi:MAG: glutaredoxin family protein [Armatimonadetes bacterium]|nr:glutaredoxin family protein [Armatimonadota bacterium]